MILNDVCLVTPLIISVVCFKSWVLYSHILASLDTEDDLNIRKHITVNSVAHQGAYSSLSVVQVESSRLKFISCWKAPLPLLPVIRATLCKVTGAEKSSENS